MKYLVLFFSFAIFQSASALTFENRLIRDIRVDQGNTIVGIETGPLCGFRESECVESTQLAELMDVHNRDAMLQLLIAAYISGKRLTIVTDVVFGRTRISAVRGGRN